MSADAQRWQRVGAVFDAVVAVPVRERDALLNRLCAGDAAMRREVEDLLRADVAAGGFERGIDSARGALARDWSESAQRVASGERIGPWRIERELGRGGMGVVLLGARADGQYEQRAALKLIKRGMDSEAILARFLRERQILARLAHPHIAHLLDGGVAADGRPYFAMEYIQGRLLLDYCREQSIKMEEMTSIFLDICAAVQFAHGQLVVHRDIKPSNILVTIDGSAKLLDFGIAKLLSADDNAAATATAAWQDRPLTPAYAAPEQLRGEPATIATDVYGLGCVLYELFTGRRPYAISDATTIDQARTLHETTSPPAPSAVAGAQAPITPRRLRGDLDTIVLKAIQHEPERRYATVDALSADLRNVLAGRPIAARRDHGLYRLRKFIARHRVGVALSALAIAALLGSLGLALWQAQAKAREAQAAQQVTRFLIELFAGSDPTRSDPTLGPSTTVSAKDLLDQGAERLRNELDTEPVVRARLLHTIATTYAALGLYDRALPLETEALALRRANLSSGAAEIADSLDGLGYIYFLKADYAQAEPLLRDALALRRAQLDKDDPALIDSLGNIGELLQSRGDFAGADGFFQEALQASERRFGADATQTARRLDDAATNLDNLGKKVEAQAAYRRALAIREKNLGPNAAEVATSLQNLGVFLDSNGDYKEALPLLERALAMRKRIFGDVHPLVGTAQLALAGVYESLNRIDDCKQSAEQALAILRKTLPPDHPKISETLNMLAIVHALRRDYAGAVPLFREVAQRYSDKLGPDHPDTLTSENNLGLTLLHAGQPAEAEHTLRGMLAQVHTDNGQGTDSMACQNLASALEAQGKTAEAVTFARRALDIQKAHDGEISGPVAIALRGVALAEALHGDASQAEADYRAALRMGEAMAPLHNIATYPWEIPLADFLVGAQRCAEALPLLDRAASGLAKPGVDPDPIWKLEVQLLRGHCLASGRQREEGMTLQKMAREQLRAIPGVEVDMYPFALRVLKTR
jgi:serine/threonine-protein kinase